MADETKKSAEKQEKHTAEDAEAALAAFVDDLPEDERPPEEEEEEPQGEQDPRLVRIKALAAIMGEGSDRSAHSLARIATKFDGSLIESVGRSKSAEEFFRRRLPAFCKTINSRSEKTGIELPVEKVQEVYQGLFPEEGEGAEAKAGQGAKVEGGQGPGKAEAERPHVVVFDHVTKTYAVGTRREFTAIQDVHFTVEDLPDKGEFISILGPSGCGKSTVLRLVAGLEPQHPPTEGSVKVFGEDVGGPGADRGMVFQSYTSFDNRTVLRNITFGLECRGGMSRRERDDLAREWIDKVGLSVKADADKYPHQLSGGMRQRVAIARTLILQPKIILMDEPFGALDPVTRMRMQDLLVALWREVEATVFFVTHSIDEAVYLGDRVFLFSRSPGTITRQIPVPPPDFPAMEMQRDPAFQDQVFELREIIDRLEREAEKEAKARAEAEE